MSRAISGNYQNTKIYIWCKDGYSGQSSGILTPSMELLFHDRSYDRLEADSAYHHGFSSDVVALYRKRLQILRAARDEGDLAALQCLHFARIPRRSRAEYTVDLNDRFQLIVELKPRAPSSVIFAIEVRACPATTP